MNKNQTPITFNWRALGAHLAKLSSDEQFAFFCGFADEMNRYPSDYARDKQLTHIRKAGMTLQQKEVYRVLAVAGD